MPDLSGRAVLVTGAGSGIGRAIALRLASEGADVAVNDAAPDRARDVAELVRQQGRRTVASLADITDELAVQEMMRAVVAELGKLDILVANAGIIATARFTETSVRDFDRVMAVNVRGVFLCAREAAKHMIPRRSGKIINAASVAGHRPTPFHIAYSASKFAVVGMTQTMARELATYGITVNAYCPGIVDTPMWDQIDIERSKLLDLPLGGARQQALASVPLGRAGKPDDIAGLVSFLASPHSDYMTGQCINICGGLVMY